MIIGIFSHFFALETTLAERQFFRALARLIGKRAARLSACGIAAIVSKMGYLDEGCAVGADGSLYNVRYQQFCFLFMFRLPQRDRSILNLQKEYTKASSTFSERKEGKLIQGCSLNYFSNADSQEYRHPSCGRWERCW